MSALKDKTQRSLANFLFQPYTVPRGPLHVDVVSDLKARCEIISQAAISSANPNLVEFGNTIKFSNNSNDLMIIAATFNGISCLGNIFGEKRQGQVLGGVMGLFGTIFGALGDANDKSTEEIEEALQKLETEIVTVNKNLIKISQQISEGFNQVSKEIGMLYDEIREVQKDIEIDSISHLVDDYLISTKDAVADYLYVIANVQGDSPENIKKREQTAEALWKNSKPVLDKLFWSIAGSPDAVSDKPFLDLIAAKFKLYQGNIPYPTWRDLLLGYLSKFNFTLINGCMAVAWATDLLEPGRSDEVFNDYKNKLSNYFRKIYATESGIFYPNNGSNIFLMKTENTDIRYTVTRAASGDSLEIENTRNQQVELSQIQIITNYSMSQCARGFWGNMLYNDGSAGWHGALLDPSTPVEMAIVNDNDNKPLFVCYTIKFAKGSYFQPNGKSILNMSFSSSEDGTFTITTTCGLQGVAMMPILSLVNSDTKYTMHLANYKTVGSNGTAYEMDKGESGSIEDGIRIVGYYSSYSIYGGRDYFATRVPYDKINVISYCFADFSEEGELSSMDSWADSFNLPAVQYALSNNPSLMAELLIGGWPDENDPKKNFLTRFKSISAQKDKRERFADNCIRTIKTLGFTGIGIDWEYPDHDDAENYITLLQTVRQKLDELSGKYTLSIAVPAAIHLADVLKPEQWQKIGDAVDFINIMAYDYNGKWSNLTDFNAPLHTDKSHPDYATAQLNCVSASVQHYIDIAKDAHIDLKKLAVGMAAYGRAFLVNKELINRDNCGRYVEHTIDAIPDLKKKDDDSGVLLYGEIIAPPSGLFPPDMQFVDQAERAEVPEQSAWAYSQTAGWFVAYDSVSSIQAKVRYVQSQGLGGAMLWELSGDSREDATSLLNQIASAYRKL